MEQHKRFAWWHTLVLMMFAGVTMARAQEAPSLVVAGDPTVSLTEAQAGVFQDALAALAAQGHVAIVAEGTPLHPRLQQRQPRPPGQAAPPAPARPLAVAMKDVADAFDYDAERRGNVFLLRKRYTDLQDLPGVTPEECAAAFADVERTMDAFNPHFPAWQPGTTTPIISEFAAALGPDQLQALRQGGLTPGALNPAQQAMLRRIALYLYVQQPAERIHVADIGAQEAQNDVLQYGNMAGQRVFGYEQTDQEYHRRVFVPFIVASHLIPVAAVSGKPGVPGPLDKPFPLTSLADVAATVSARGTPVAVDPALRDKPITVVGDAAAPVPKVVSAMADVYGLRLKTDKDGRLLLSSRQFIIPLEVTALPDSVRQRLPDPLLRALHLDRLYAVRQQTNGHPQTAEASAGTAGQAAELQRNQNELERLLGVGDALCQEAVRRLSVEFQARQSGAKPTGRVPLSSLSASGRQAFAVFLAVAMLGGISDEFPPQVPEYIAQFDQVTVSGGPYKDKDGHSKYALNFSLSGPGGSGTGAGMSNMEYDP